VLDTLWKKPLPSKLFHLERVAHRPDNLLLPTTVTSLTRREDIHKFSPSLLWPVHHAQSSTAWLQQPIGKNKHALPQQVQQPRDSLTVSVSVLGLYEVFLQRSDGFTLRRSGRMPKIPLPRFILSIIFACTRVDTCHPGKCMRSPNMHPFACFPLPGT
jgi:hypothetical protein